MKKSMCVGLKHPSTPAPLFPPYQKHSLEALKQLLEAFRCAVHMSDEPELGEGATAGKRGKKKATDDAVSCMVNRQASC